jgi:ribulose-5-phosphate 4-epimerase/fuculose-1-phosphate aldolase
LSTIDAIKEKMVLYCKVLQKQGVLDGYGHLTYRLDNRILSTPRMPPGKVTLRDLIVLDANGKKLEGDGAPNGETPMHVSIYAARPDVRCILHYHPDELVAVSVAGDGIKVVVNSGIPFARGVPIFDSPLLIRTSELGSKVAQTLGDRNAVILRGHGGTVVARDLDTLLRLGIDLVRTAKVQIMAAALGPLKVHTAAEAEEAVKKDGERGADQRFLDYYISEAIE